jgi:hypothetical protein
MLDNRVFFGQYFERTGTIRLAKTLQLGPGPGSPGPAGRRVRASRSSLVTVLSWPVVAPYFPNARTISSAADRAGTGNGMPPGQEKGVGARPGPGARTPLSGPPRVLTPFVWIPRRCDIFKLTTLQPGPLHRDRIPATMTRDHRVRATPGHPFSP